MTEMDLNELEKTSGGVIVDTGEKKLYIVRQDGTVIGPAPSQNAVSFAKTMSVSTEIITAEEYEKRFGRPVKW